jgi:hypothetical protein
MSEDVDFLADSTQLRELVMVQKFKPFIYRVPAGSSLTLRAGTYYSIINLAPVNAGQCLFRSSDVHALST